MPLITRNTNNSMAIRFREDKDVPQRTYTGSKLASYRGYKKYLKSDFGGRCGYTNCNHLWFGGSSNFHIDHFKPKSKYPHLETEYNNLVYSCSYVNIAKSDDDFEYLDPCDDDYNEHFYRDAKGSIHPIETSSKAVYMHTKLKLYLSRYSIIYMLDLLLQKMNQLKKVIEGLTDEPYKNEVLQLQGELANEFIGYLEYLEIEQ
ncbi:hypothetical protein [Maribacter litoralis]|uniref:hypothetical protein n=1 Tax=Maribacter litoralis TaxID=2059726 RepID=UPI003F5CCFDC